MDRIKEYEETERKHWTCGQPFCKTCGHCSYCICRCNTKGPGVIFQESRAYWRDMIRSN